MLRGEAQPFDTVLPHLSELQTRVVAGPMAEALETVRKQ